MEIDTEDDGERERDLPEREAELDLERDFVEVTVLDGPLRVVDVERDRDLDSVVDLVVVTLADLDTSVVCDTDTLYDADAVWDTSRVWDGPEDDSVGE